MGNCAYKDRRRLKLRRGSLERVNESDHERTAALGIQEFGQPGLRWCDYPLSEASPKNIRQRRIVLFRFELLMWLLRKYGVILRN